MLIRYIYRSRDELGNRVRGHEARCYALSQAFERLGYKRSYDSRDADIVVFDGIQPLPIEGDALIVNMIDQPHTDVFLEHINISPGFYREDNLDLSGPRYTIVRDQLFSVPRTRNISNVLFIPGGNHESFWEQASGDIIGICLDHGYEITRLFGEDWETAAQMIISADLVVCPASVCALEAASIGKPLLLVETASDQRYNYDGLIFKNSCALPYSENNLEYLLRSIETRTTLGENGRRTVNIRGKDLVAAYIDEKVKEWNQ